MSVADAPPLVSLQEWDEVWSCDDRYLELSNGVLVPASRERAWKLVAAAELAFTVRQAVGRRVAALQRLEVLIQHAVQVSVRRPDVVFIATEYLSDNPHRVEGSLVEGVAEVLSPSTARVDKGEKVVEYAQAGIPAYLLADIRDPQQSHLTLYSDPRDGEYQLRIDGLTISLPLLDANIAVNARDLLPMTHCDCDDPAPTVVRDVHPTAPKPCRCSAYGDHGNTTIRTDQAIDPGHQR